MKLFLASEAKHPDSIEKLQQFLGGSFEKKKILYIPTAANGERWQSWKEGKSIQVVNSLNAEVEVVELEFITEEELITQTEGIDIIWFAGGMSGYLLYWIRRRKLEQLLPSLLAKGVTYVGSSSGAMVVSKTQHVSSWYVGESEPGADLIPGLGLVDFEIYPHYKEEVFPLIESKWQTGALYLIKDGEAITVTNDIVSVLGEERVIRK